MKSLIELKVYLINKYLNKDYRLDDTTAHVLGGEKIEYHYLNNLLFKGIENSLKMYEPLLLIGTTKEIKSKLSMYQDVVDKWNINESKYNKMNIDIFVKDFNIDVNEIDNIVLNLINNSLKG